SEAVQAYDKIQNDPHTLGVVLEYPEEVQRNTRVEIVTSKRTAKSGPVVAGVIGAGNFAKSTLMPALAATDARIAAVVDLEPAAAKDVAEKYGAEAAMSDYTELLADDTVNTVFILAGHSVHGRLVCEALAAGKHVFVEKPLAMNEEQLQEVEAAYAKANNNGNGQQLMVGFNRRFSPHVAELTKVLKGHSDPLCMTMTVNAGYIPPDHWTQDPQRGGGRIIGEACHFLDLLASIAGAPIEHISAMRVGGNQPVRDDKMSIIMGFGDGSVGTVNYFANGAKSYPKETLEVFSDNRVLRLDNFRILRGYGVKGFKKFKSRRQDKGHKAEVAAFVKRIAEGGEALIPIEELLNTTRASFAAMLSARDKGQRKKPLMDADER
ncbi:MAG: Gfo/Idh/MocA family protein, partial [Planctomycetota bacterium]